MVVTDSILLTGDGEATQQVGSLIVVEKMHLWRLVFGVKNSIVAAQ